MGRPEPVVGRHGERHRSVDAGDLLDADGVRRHVHSGPSVRLGDADPEEPHLRELGNELAGKLLGAVPGLGVRGDLGPGEFADALSKEGVLLGELEVHGRVAPSGRGQRRRKIAHRAGSSRRISRELCSTAARDLALEGRRTPVTGAARSRAIPAGIDGDACARGAIGAGRARRTHVGGSRVGLEKVRARRGRPERALCLRLFEEGSERVGTDEDRRCAGTPAEGPRRDADDGAAPLVEGRASRAEGRQEAREASAESTRSRHHRDVVAQTGRALRTHSTVRT